MAQGQYGVDPSQIKFCVVEIDKDEWKKWIEYNKTLDKKSWKEPDRFEFMYDSFPYEIPLKGQTTIPKAAADHGQRLSLAFPQGKDERGRLLKDNDKRGARSPMLKIVRTISAVDLGVERKAEMLPQRCPFCEGEFAREDFRQHIEDAHMQQSTPEDPVATEEAQPVDPRERLAELKRKREAAKQNELVGA